MDSLVINMFYSSQTQDFNTLIPLEVIKLIVEKFIKRIDFNFIVTNSFIFTIKKASFD